MPAIKPITKLKSKSRKEKLEVPFIKKKISEIVKKYNPPKNRPLSSPLSSLININAPPINDTTLINWLVILTAKGEKVVSLTTSAKSKTKTKVIITAKSVAFNIGAKKPLTNPLSNRKTPQSFL